jgi:hypothetical protein
MLDMARARAETLAATVSGRPDDGGPPGPVESERMGGDRATALIEDICYEKISGCSYRGGGASHSMFAMPR